RQLGWGSETFLVPFAIAPVGVVRAGRGLAGSGRDRAPQAGARFRSSRPDEPPLRLADPAFEPRCVPGVGIGRVWRHLGLAEPRSLAVRARLGRVCPLTPPPGCRPADL